MNTTMPTIGVISGGGVDLSSMYVDTYYSATFNASGKYTFTKDYDLVVVYLESGENRSAVMKIDGAASTHQHYYSNSINIATFSDVKSGSVYGPYGSGNSWPTKIFCLKRP